MMQHPIVRCHQFRIRAVRLYPGWPGCRFPGAVDDRPLARNCIKSSNTRRRSADRPRTAAWSMAAAAFLALTKECAASVGTTGSWLPAAQPLPHPLLQLLLPGLFTLALALILYRIFRRQTRELQRQNQELEKTRQNLLTEIQTRKIQEQQLRESEQRYFNLFANNHSIMLIIDPGSGRIIDANPAACRYYGYSHKELTSMSISDINTLAEEEVFEEMSKAKSEKRNHFLFRHRLASGETRDVEVYSGPITIDKKQLLYSIIHDITERKKAEAALRKSKDEWDRTFNSFTDMVILTDLELRIRKANRAARVMLGSRKDEDIIGHHCYNLLHGRSTPCPSCPVQQTIEDLQPCTKEMYIESLQRTFMISTGTVFDDQGRLEFVAHVAKDITELRQLKEKLAQAQKMKAIGTLAGGIAHDFNNILSAILGFATLARQKADPGSAITADLDNIIAAGQRASDLVRQILTFSRTTRSEPEPLRPAIVIQEALVLVRSSLPASIVIEEKIDPDCGMIKADPTHIHQIIINLCTNALQAMENEKGTVRISLQRETISPHELDMHSQPTRGQYIVLSVSDTGCGMKPETINQIFEPYFTTRTPDKGTGLGLAVVHGIVQSYNGFIRVQSTLGQGTTFNVYLPALDRAQETIPENSPPDIAPVRNLYGNENILIVDDEPQLTRVAEKTLAPYGYRVATTTDSREALVWISESPKRFDCLVTDQTMPGLTGAELARAVLRINPNMPVLLCTGHSSTVSREQALAIGISRYIIKPVVGNTLVRLVREALDEKKK
ncbi:PAS domain-containing hybrid sensor histidine kinase/response regulator [Desulfolithobacter sp.]